MKKIKFPTLNEQMDLISKGTIEILPENELEKKIFSSIENEVPLFVKFGCDPTNPDLHLGHSVVLKKLQDFQNLGHKAILLIGDFTAMIGDPSGRNKLRPQIDQKIIKENMQTYINQAGCILDMKHVRIAYNSKWLKEIDFLNLINICSKITVSRMIEREDFNKRYKSGIPIFLHEFLYPIAQAYDSVHLKADIELGGTDQKFNLLMARDLQREFNINPQVVITTPIIEGTDGKEKMSKSLNNFIGLTEKPSDMYGKILSIPDELILRYFEFCTWSSLKEVKDIKKRSQGESWDPRNEKRSLARKIVEIYHSREKANKAELDFDNLFIKKDIPDNIPTFSITEKDFLIDSIVKSKIISSRSEFKRLVKQGAVTVDGKKVDDFRVKASTLKLKTIKIGKRKFLQLI